MPKSSTPVISGNKKRIWRAGFIFSNVVSPRYGHIVPRSCFADPSDDLLLQARPEIVRPYSGASVTGCLVSLLV